MKVLGQQGTNSSLYVLFNWESLEVFEHKFRMLNVRAFVGERKNRSTLRAAGDVVVMED